MQPIYDESGSHFQPVEDYSHQHAYYDQQQEHYYEGFH